MVSSGGDFCIWYWLASIWVFGLFFSVCCFFVRDVRRLGVWVGRFVYFGFSRKLVGRIDRFVIFG